MQRQYTTPNRARKGNPDRVEIKTSDGQHTAGYYYPASRTFRKTITDNHILSKPPALAVDAGAIVQLTALGCATIEFKHRLTGQVWSCTFLHFLEKSFEFDRGFGRQRALPLNGFIRRGPGISDPPAAPPAPRKDPPTPTAPRQMTLFGGGL